MITVNKNQIQVDLLPLKACVHCFKCRFFHFCVLEICITWSTQFMSACTGFLFPVYSRSCYGLYSISFFYLPMYCTFPVVIFVHRNIAAYFPEFRYPQGIQWAYYMQRIFRHLFNNVLWPSGESVGLPCAQVRIMQFQGWEFAHWFSERIARFLPKNE